MLSKELLEHLLERLLIASEIIAPFIKAERAMYLAEEKEFDESKYPDVESDYTDKDRAIIKNEKLYESAFEAIRNIRCRMHDTGMIAEGLPFDELEVVLKEAIHNQLELERKGRPSKLYDNVQESCPCYKCQTLRALVGGAH